MLILLLYHFTQKKTIQWRTIKLVLGILLLWSFTGCTSNPSTSNGIAYYQFRGDDFPKLLPYKTNEVLLFRDQFNQERRFGFTQIDRYYRSSYTVGMGFFTSYAAKYFDYDEKNIQCNINSSGCYRLFSMHFVRWPLNTELAKNNSYVEYPSAFTAYIDDFPYWNKNSANYGIDNITIRYDQPTMQLSCFNTTYTQVLKLESNSNTALPNSAQDVPRNVHILYYDITQGIVGYDDLDGHQWRLYEKVSLKK